MRKILLTFSLFLTASFLSAANPPKHIDVGNFPATDVSGVVVPVPSEVFGILDKLQNPNWHEMLQEDPIKKLGERPQIALLLGTVIAEGFVAVEAQNSTEVKKIGRNVLNLAGAIGVRKSVVARSESIIEAADEKNWDKVRIELDGALKDVEDAMIELNDAQLAQLVSLGGWLRGTEVLTSIVRKNYSTDGAELLNQPLLLDYFKERLDDMSPRLRSNNIVKQIHERLPKIRPLIQVNGGAIPKASVEEINKITSELVQLVTQKQQP